MEDHLTCLAATHLLQHTLRSLCIHEDSHWVYAVFWRILPRNYPPPKWDFQGDGTMERSRGNRRNWWDSEILVGFDFASELMRNVCLARILAWEDGFCNFAASSGKGAVHGLQPELFFKMSHEIYNYGEGLLGKVAADRSHKWVFKDPQEQETSLLSSWNNPADAHPRTWEAQFQAGIKTIVLIAVKEGVIQLGTVNQIPEDPAFVILLRNKFTYLESIPGVLLPHPSSAAIPPPEKWAAPPLRHNPLGISPSMSSLEALLSKLPSVSPLPPVVSLSSPPKEELRDEDYNRTIAASSEMNGHGIIFY